MAIVTIFLNRTLTSVFVISIFILPTLALAGGGGMSTGGASTQQTNWSDGETQHTITQDGTQISSRDWNGDGDISDDNEVWTNATSNDNDDNGNNWGQPPPPPVVPDATGYFDLVNINRCSVAGWAYDPASPNTSISVDVYENGQAGKGGTFLMNCNANLPRVDINNAVAPGNHGFNCILPATYVGTGQHNLYIHALDIDGAPNALLNSSPRALNCISVVGNVSFLGSGQTYPGLTDPTQNTACTVVSGWACDPSSVATPVDVEMLIDNSLVTTVSADITRRDLEGPNNIWSHCGLYTPDAQHGFSYTIPVQFKDNATHTLRLRAKNIGIGGSAVDKMLATMYRQGQSFLNPRNFSFNCPALGNLADIETGLSLLANRQTGLSYNLPTQIKVSSVGTLSATSSFTVRLHFDRIVGGYANNTYNTTVGNADGDFYVDQVVNTVPFITGQTIAVPFTNIIQPLPGLWRAKVTADVNGQVESSGTPQRSNNNSTWREFMVESPVTPDLNANDLVVTSGCFKPAAGNVCPPIKLSLKIGNTGTAVPNTDTIRYEFEYRTNGSTGPWLAGPWGNWTAGIPSYTKTAAIVGTLSNLSYGEYEVRALVNMDAARTGVIVSESDILDNISAVRKITNPPPTPTVTLASQQMVVRKGGTINLDWSINAAYIMDCDLLGPGVGQVFEYVATSTTVVGIGVSTPLTSAQTFRLTCNAGTVNGYKLPPVVRAVTVDVIPTVEEI
jgi:hypothetical protein